MKNKNISAISVQEIDNTIGALKELRQRMPFLVSLTPLERRHGTHVGPHQIKEAQVSLTAAREFPGILPSSFDMALFEQTVQATARLHQCLSVLKGLTSDIQDTILSLGADAVTGSQQVRALAKAVAKTTPGLGQLLKSLAPRPRASVVEGADETTPGSGPDPNPVPESKTPPEAAAQDKSEAA